MTLLEDITNGKYNIILFSILFIFMFHQYWNKTPENMTDVLTTDQIKSAVKEIYMVDVEAIRNLSNVATQLQAGGLTIPGDLTIRGDLTLNGKALIDGDTTVKSGKLELGNLESNKWAFNSIQSDDGTFSLGRVGRNGVSNENVGMKLISSADGTANLGGVFSLVPKGTIVAWSGAIAPVGWALCDGIDGRPDLLGRFILGAGQGTGLSNRLIGDKDGVEQVTLTIDQMPAHTHNFLGKNAPWSNRFATGTGSTKNLSTDDNLLGTTDPVGGGVPHNNMPPFYALAYIIKL